MKTFYEVIAAGNYIILDTETTGLDNLAEVCSIAIVDSEGGILLDTLIKPIRGIPAKATDIHGITNEMVANAPSWRKMSRLVQTLLTMVSHNLICYNSDYDIRVMNQSAKAAGMNVDYGKMPHQTFCAMTEYAEKHGEWSDYHQSYRYEKLVNAAKHFNVNTDGAHGALADCLMTLEVCKGLLAENGGAK